MSELTDLMHVFEAAEKYAMDNMLQYLQEAIVANASKDPIATFAFGSRHGLRDIIIAGAKESLNKHFGELGYSPELERITGAQMHKLYNYHERCRKAIPQMVCQAALDARGTSNELWFLTGRRECDCQRPTLVKGRFGLPPGAMRGPAPDSWVIYVRLCWQKYEENLLSELKNVPRGHTATSRKILDPILFAGQAGCKNVICVQEGTRELTRFSGIQSELIEKSVTEVSTLTLLCNVFFGSSNLLFTGVNAMYR